MDVYSSVVIGFKLEILINYTTTLFVFAFEVIFFNMKIQSHSITSLIVRSIMVVIGLLVVWLLRPVSPNQTELTIAVESLDETSAASQAQDTKQVNLLLDTPVTESATEEMMEGRFIMETSVNQEIQKAEVYRQLLLRGGIVVSLDQNASYVLISKSGERIPLERISAEHLNLDNYALHRPRHVAAGDHHHLSGAIKKGDEVFIVMPNQFESKVFSNIERVLGTPLSNYGKALVDVSISPRGHLDFTLARVTKNDGTAISSNHLMRGL